MVPRAQRSASAPGSGSRLPTKGRPDVLLAVFVRKEDAAEQPARAGKAFGQP